MKYICPKCKQREGVENSIGCLIYHYLPDRRCLNCGHEWDIVRRKTKISFDNVIPLLTKYGKKESPHE